MNVPIVALLTDFGTSDPYVGVMKGVILTHCPTAQCIDITHEVAPQNVWQAGYLLYTAYRYFPPHTVFLVVVDPDVGTQRPAIAIHTSHGYFVGPDNDIFNIVRMRSKLRTIETVVLPVPPNASNTFHGRDVFAPAAAAIANGVPLTELGTPYLYDGVYDIPQLTLTESVIYGAVIHIDHFGNVITSIGECHWTPDGQITLETYMDETVTFDPTTCNVRIGGHRIDQVIKTYGLARLDAPLGLISSDGQLEIAINRGHAAGTLNIHLGDSVELHFQRTR